jgi:hypothetical protein
MSEDIIAKLRRLAALAPDGQRVFGFATLLNEVADQLETFQPPEKGESNMSEDRTIAQEVRQRRLAAIRQAIELGHVGGNEDTEWLLEDVERLDAALQQAQATIPPCRRWWRRTRNCVGLSCWRF